jgi:hypothetical protein
VFATHVLANTRDDDDDYNPDDESENSYSFYTVQGSSEEYEEYENVDMNSLSSTENHSEMNQRLQDRVDAYRETMVMFAE